MSSTDVLLIGAESDLKRMASPLAKHLKDYCLRTASNKPALVSAVQNAQRVVVLISLVNERESKTALRLLKHLRQQAEDSAFSLRVIAVCDASDERASEALTNGCDHITLYTRDWEQLAGLIRDALRLAELSIKTNPQQPARRLPHRAHSAGLAAELPLANTDQCTDTPESSLIIGQSQSMLALKTMITRIASADINVLVCGETGTGKELVAQEIHNQNASRTGPLVAVNCAAIPDNLLESELFGHERGAFTGALSRKLGKIETAAGGTLFLDEIGDMPPALQAKLLRFIEDRHIERVGSNDRIPVDVRLVAATHQNIAEQITNGTFRQDLYYRLAEITLTLPPLRERENDTLLIARYLLRKYAAAKTKSASRSKPASSPVLSEEALDALARWHWPGNVRELENILKRACLLTTTGLITVADLELFDVAKRHDRLLLAEPAREAADPAESGNSDLNLQEVRRQAEQKAIIRAFARAGDNVSKAAKLLGVTRPTLYDLMDKYNIRVKSAKQPPVERNAQKSAKNKSRK